jgi:hypothetical protein
MPPLTWRDVAAPDFSTSLGALKLAGTDTTQAFSGLGDALGKFNNYTQDQNAAALMANATKYTNPADLQAAFANGSIFNGVNPNYVSADALQKTQGQVGTLLSNAANTEQNAFNLAADPSRLNLLRDTDTVNAATQAARIAKPGLENNKLVADTGYTNASSGYVGSQTKALDQSTAQGGITFQRNTAAYDAHQEALPFLSKLDTATQNQYDVNQLLASPEVAALSPMAQQELINHSKTLFANPASAAISGAANGGGGGGAPGTRAGATADMTYGGVPTPGPVGVSQQPIGDVLNLQKNILLPQTGHSPLGNYQITADTLADFGPKVFGANWEKTIFTPDNQDKLAEAIFNASKAGNLQDRWSSLPDATPGAYKDKTFAEMKPIIMQGEVGSSGASGAPGPSGQPNPAGDINAQLLDLKSRLSSVNTDAAITGGNVGAQINEALSGGVAGKYNMAMADNQSTPGEMADQMSASGSYKGAPVARLTNDINAIIAKAGGKITPAAARVILEAHPQGAGFVSRNLPAFVGGYNLIPNMDATDADSEAAKNGSLYATAQTAATAQAMQAKIETARANYEEASRQVAIALKNPAMAKNLPSYRNNLATAKAVFDQTAGAVKGNVTLQPSWEQDRQAKLQEAQKIQQQQAAAAIAAAATAGIPKPTPALVPPVAVATPPRQGLVWNLR